MCLDHFSVFSRLGLDVLCECFQDDKKDKIMRGGIIDKVSYMTDLSIYPTYYLAFIE